MAAPYGVSDWKQEIEDTDDIIQPLLKQGTRQDQLPTDHLSFSLDLPLPGPEAQVEIPDLKDIYDKVQKKTTSGSEQRVTESRVNIIVNATAQISSIRVFVRRSAEAAKKTNDKVGPVELPVDVKKHEVFQITLCVDLDSVYEKDASPIYWLDKVDVEERNKWELVVLVEFIDSTQKTFQSNSFRLRTKPRPPKKTELEPTPPLVPQPVYSAQHQEDVEAPNNNKRKRSSPSTSSYEPPTENPFSIISGSPYSQTGSTHGGGFGSPPSAQSNEAVLTDYLEAQRACIQHLAVKKMICTPNADIAYHVQLKKPNYRRNVLEEGDVVGFFEHSNTGQSEIAPLTQDNASKARMAGVISRSAYLEGNVPSSNIDQTDTVCVIGIVKIKVTGPAQNGERIYASLDRPGLGVPETQIPLRPMAGKTPILLGQTLESLNTPMMNDVNLVKCFVSIVMGIQSQQVSIAIEDLQGRMQSTMKETMKKEKKRFLRGLIWKGIVILVILALLTFFLYELLAPGSLFRYYLCRRKSIRPQRDVWFTYTTDTHQTPRVHGIEFVWENLKEKLGLRFHKYNESGMHYYLNIDRCAYGGTVLGSYIDNRPLVGGPEVFTVNSTCDGVMYEEDGTWHGYRSSRKFLCRPPYSY